MTIKSKSITLVDVDAIIPHPKNSNRHSIEQIKRLAKLIKHNGFRQPLIVSNHSGFLIAGHGRLEASKLLGMEKLPVIYQDLKNDAEEFQFLTADNAIQAWSELDMQSVHEFLDSVDEFDMELLGINKFSVDDVDSSDNKEVSFDETKEFSLLIVCCDELDQADLYSEFQTRELDCKIL